MMAIRCFPMVIIDLFHAGKPTSERTYLCMPYVLPILNNPIMCTPHRVYAIIFLEAKTTAIVSNNLYARKGNVLFLYLEKTKEGREYP